jgi:hypothetical protein
MSSCLDWCWTFGWVGGRPRSRDASPISVHAHRTSDARPRWPDCSGIHDASDLIHLCCHCPQMNTFLICWRNHGLAGGGVTLRAGCRWKPPTSVTDGRNRSMGTWIGCSPAGHLRTDGVRPCTRYWITSLSKTCSSRFHALSGLIVSHRLAGPVPELPTSANDGRFISAPFAPGVGRGLNLTLDALP